MSVGVTAHYRTTLTSRGDYFAVNGVGRFIVFTSYFDGLNRPTPTLRADLEWLRARGIGGIRVWPNSPPTSIMNADGHLDPAVVSRLLTLVDEAAARGMVVDLTFHREAVECPSSDCTFTTEEFSDAIVAVAHALIRRRNVLFDLQNEWNVHRQGMRLRDFRALRDRVRTVNTAIPITASVTFGYGEARAAEDALDVLAFHEGRDIYGSWAYDTDRLLGRLREARSALVPPPGRSTPRQASTSRRRWRSNSSCSPRSVVCSTRSRPNSRTSHGGGSPPHAASGPARATRDLGLWRPVSRTPSGRPGSGRPIDARMAARKAELVAQRSRTVTWPLSGSKRSPGLTSGTGTVRTRPASGRLIGVSPPHR